ncbi:MAG: HK97-gp10 family putative phage morphogenesis protein [Candidatus Nanopelagicales bacterium]
MTPETKKLLDSMKSFLSVGELGFSAGLAADIFAAEARLRAPVKTGKLRSAIVAKINKIAEHFGAVGAAYVSVDYKIAPHAHLVEYGGRGGEMPAQPFMRPAVDSKQSEAGKAVETDLLKRINLRFK